MAYFSTPILATFYMPIDIRKGERARKVEKWTFYTKADQDGEPTKEISSVSVRYFNVFNAEQIDGVPSIEKNTAREIKTVEKAEAIISGCPVPIRYGGSDAVYNSADFIKMPLRKSFFSDAAFYATMFHEMGHSTGNHKRLDRAMCGRFGDPAYAFEELVAEFCAAFVSKDIGIEHDANAYEKHLENHAAYIRSWSKARFDKKRILEAISQANQASNMVLTWGK